MARSSPSFVITCGPSKLNNRAASGGIDREHIVSRPSVIGAVPLYYLLKAGQELKAHLPNLSPHVRDTQQQSAPSSPVSPPHVSSPPVFPPSATTTLREAAEGAIKEMALKDAEIALLKKQCRELQRALDDSTKSATSTEAPKLGRELSSAYLQRIQSERLVERLQADVSELQTGLEERDGDLVKMNMMSGVLAVVALTFWIQSGGSI